MEHERLHTKPFKCNMCVKSFYQNSQLKKHETMHTTDGKVFMCKFCRKLFSSKNGLNYHQKKCSEAYQIQSLHKEIDIKEENLDYQYNIDSHEKYSVESYDNYNVNPTISNTEEIPHTMDCEDFLKLEIKEEVMIKDEGNDPLSRD